MALSAPFPHRVRTIENCWIPLPDGGRLAARVWLPEDADRAPVPAIVEYIPYRKRDGTRWRDEPIHRYFAGHGYASIRIDIRGSGESDGLLADEYLPREQLDGVAAIAWVAAQPWCSGSVGMIGKSWGGFNALQIAARRPTALKAIISVCASDDRYLDDAHYMGGCVLSENFLWGSVLFTLAAQPPDPELVGERWRAMWRERLEQLPFYAETWLRHQRRDGYWEQGSVSTDYEAIACPVYAIGGWADAYRNAVPRLLQHLRVPRKGLIGPWAHRYPHRGVPGPAIGFQQEALRWWDHWLKGVDTGIMDEPMYRVWMQESVPPRTFYTERPGRWVAEPAWPSRRVRPLRLALAPDRLVSPHQAMTADVRMPVRSDQAVGAAAGHWCPFGIGDDLAGDQRRDDAGSLVFTSEPLQARMELLGAPAVTLRCSGDRPAGLIAVRLNDVAPDGSATRVTYGLLNLAHRESHARPTPLVPGEPVEVTVTLNHIAHAFPPGHRVGLAISTAYWPIAWPAAQPLALTVFAAGSMLELPVRPPDEADATLRPFDPPAVENGDAESENEPHTVEYRDRGDESEVHVMYGADEHGEPVLECVDAIALQFGYAFDERFAIGRHDPLSARLEIVHKHVRRRGEWHVRVNTTTRVSATAAEFLLEAELDAREGNAAVAQRRWRTSIPRDLA